AGMLELADLYVVNKADRPGARALADSLQGALEIAHAAGADRRLPPIVLTSAAGADLDVGGDGLPALFEAVDSLLGELTVSGALEERRRAQRRQAVESRVLETLADQARTKLLALPGLMNALQAVESREVAPATLAEWLIAAVSPSD
ncbi:MAG TPA: hypothetical protein VEI97_13210, partial [bacterium]|nr:hypothetical protein [bacterium]